MGEDTCGFAGPYQSKMFLIVVDAHLKWPEVIQMSSTFHISRTNSDCIKTIICYLWTTTATSVRQWPPIYGSRIPTFSEGKRSKAHPMHTLPSIIQWIGRAVC